MHALVSFSSHRNSWVHLVVAVSNKKLSQNEQNGTILGTQDIFYHARAARETARFKLWV
jgi:hypothetical protein